MIYFLVLTCLCHVSCLVFVVVVVFLSFCLFLFCFFPLAFNVRKRKKNASPILHGNRILCCFFFFFKVRCISCLFVFNKHALYLSNCRGRGWCFNPEHTEEDFSPLVLIFVCFVCLVGNWRRNCYRSQYLR